MPIPTLDLGRAHASVTGLLAEARDIVVERVGGPVPAWAVARGWGEYLLGLSEADVDRADTEGIAAHFAADPACPSSLRELAARVAAACTAIPRLAGVDADARLRSANLRKGGQVAAVLRVLREHFGPLSGIVDVGAGRGHLTTRAAASTAVPVLGIERQADRVATARALARDVPVEFVVADVVADPDNPLARMSTDPRRLLMALHACGEAGDLLVRAAVATRSNVLLLGCCPQKIRAEARVALTPGGPAFPRAVLGLANVLDRTAGIEGELRTALAAKEARLLVRHLLGRRGLDLAAGEEMRGVNRRAANAGLPAFARAVCRVRGLAAPSPDEIAIAAARAHADYLAQRRLSLPRSMLGRALELFLALDRACFLAQQGYRASVVELFPVALSPRNLAVLGVST